MTEANNLEWLDNELEDLLLRHLLWLTSKNQEKGDFDLITHKLAITAKISEMLISEVSNILPLLDAEFAYYAGGKPYSNATGTTDKNSRIKKVIENRIAELRKRKDEVLK